MIKEAGPFGAMKDWGKAFWQKGKDVYKDVQNNALQNRNNRQVQELYTNFSKLTPEAQQAFLAKTQPTQQSNSALVPSATPTPASPAATPGATSTPQQAPSATTPGAAPTTPTSTPAATQVATALTSKMKDIKNELAKLQDKPTAYQAVLQFMSDNGMTDPVLAQGFAKFFTGFDGSSKPGVGAPGAGGSGAGAGGTGVASGGATTPAVTPPVAGGPAIGGSMGGSPISMEDGTNAGQINWKVPSSFPQGQKFTTVSNNSNKVYQQKLSSTSKMLFKIA